MGVAATRRGDKLISRQLQGDQRRPEFLLMDDLNALPKLPGSGRPWGPMAIQRDSQGFWWALDPKKLFFRLRLLLQVVAGSSAILAGRGDRIRLCNRHLVDPAATPVSNSER